MPKTTSTGQISAVTRSKHLVKATAALFADNPELAKAFDSGLVTEFAEVSKELGDISLPLPMQLQNAKNEQAAHYATVQVIDGKAQFTPAWTAKNNTISANIARLEKAIKAQKDRAAAKAKAQTATNSNQPKS